MARLATQRDGAHFDALGVVLEDLRVAVIDLANACGKGLVGALRDGGAIRAAKVVQLHGAVVRGRDDLGGAAAGQELDAKDVEAVQRLDTPGGPDTAGVVPQHDLRGRHLGYAAACVGFAQLESQECQHEVPIGTWHVRGNSAPERTARHVARITNHTCLSSDPDARMEPSSFQASRFTHPRCPDKCCCRDSCDEKCGGKCESLLMFCKRPAQLSAGSLRGQGRLLACDGLARVLRR